MVRRGPYAKGVAKREEILDAALEILAAKGYGHTTVAELAEVVGLSQTGLLHYFGSKDQLFTAVLRHQDELRRREVDGLRRARKGVPVDRLSPKAAELIVESVRLSAEVPGLVQLSARLSAEASEPCHPAHEFFGERYASQRTVTADLIRLLLETGQLPGHLDPDRTAVLLTAVVEGLQILWMHDPDLDMADHVAYLWNLIRHQAEPDPGHRPARATT